MTGSDDLTEEQRDRMNTIRSLRKVYDDAKAALNDPEISEYPDLLLRIWLVLDKAAQDLKALGIDPDS